MIRFKHQIDGVFGTVYLMESTGVWIDWQREEESGALSRFALNPDPAAMIPGEEAVKFYQEELKKLQ